MRLLLASQSPRRQELLKNLGYHFETVKIECDENFPADMEPARVAGFLSELKAKAFGDVAPDEVLLTADTVVVVNSKILGKPRDDSHAREMLAELSGKNHQVYTGVSVKTSVKTITETDCAEVSFDNISPEEADFYINNCKPFDKAGGYGIQEWLGMAKISKITGSYYTIMGLPTHIVYRLLQQVAT